MVLPNSTQSQSSGRKTKHLPSSPFSSSSSASMAMEAMANLALIALLLTAVSADTAPYTNHTVGGAAGWFFNSATNTPATEYTKWAESQTFNLGDFLIFNTNANQTVIQTYNQTTYRNCSTADALDGDTFVYTGGNTTVEALTVAVPLTIEGSNYYFSDANDGVPCLNGMAFEIVVKHGAGLPPSLNQPPPPPYMAPPPSDSSETSPSTDTTEQQETFHNGGFRSDANARPWILVLLFIGFFILA